MVEVVDIRMMTQKQRKDVLDNWFKLHLNCRGSGEGHRWLNHRWVPDLKVWVWEPCPKCGLMRITQTRGNCIEINKHGYVVRVLIVNDDFEGWKEILWKLRRFKT